VFDIAAFVGFVVAVALEFASKSHSAYRTISIKKIEMNRKEGV